MTDSSHYQGLLPPDPLEAYLAGVLSTFDPLSERHPEDCLPMARAVLDALADWEPDDNRKETR